MQLVRRQKLLDVFFICCVFLPLAFGMSYLQAEPTIFEANFLLMARDALTSHNWTLASINSQLQPSVPIFYIWLLAAWLKICGASIFCLRIGHVFLAQLSLVLVYLLTQYLYDRKIAWLACLTLLSSAIFFLLMTSLTPLILGLTLFLIVLSCLLHIMLKEAVSLFAVLGFWIFSALLVLSAGFFILLAFALSLIIWACVFHQTKQLKKLLSIRAVLAFVVIVGLWLYLANKHHTDFLNYYFYKMPWQIIKTQPFYFFLPFLKLLLFLFLAFLPWSLFLPVTLPYNRGQKEARDLIGSYFFIFVFCFLFSAALFQKSSAWLIIVLPLLSIMNAYYFAAVWQNENRKLRKGVFEITVILLALSLLALFSEISHQSIPNAHVLNFKEIAFICICLSALVLLPILYFCKPKIIFAVFLALGLNVLFVLTVFAHVLQINLQIKLWAQTINKMKQPDDLLVSYKMFNPLFSYYLQENIIWVEPKLSSFDNKFQALLVDKKTFWQISEATQKRFFMLLPVEEYGQLPKNTYTILGSTPNILLISNQEPLPNAK